MAASTDAASLIALRTKFVTLLTTETDYQIANGPKPSYSLDGETMNWDQWRDGMLERIDKVTGIIQKLQGPILIRSRGRA